MPVSTSTKIFHDIIYGNAEIRFIKGRVRFNGINTFGKIADQNPMHDSMIVIFRPIIQEKEPTQLELDEEMADMYGF